MIKWNKKFKYPESIRSLINDERHYDIGQEKLPSVTTILQATQSAEKKKILEDWKNRVGADNAENIKNEAANRGSIMHRIIESHLLGQRHADLSDQGMLAGTMAQTIIDEGLEGSMNEIWGTEITLYYPKLYAGASDLQESMKEESLSWTLNNLTDQNKKLGSLITSYNLQHMRQLITRFMELVSILVLF